MKFKKLYKRLKAGLKLSNIPHLPLKGNDLFQNLMESVDPNTQLSNCESSESSSFTSATGESEDECDVLSEFKRNERALAFGRRHLACPSKSRQHHGEEFVNVGKNGVTTFGKIARSFKIEVKEDKIRKESSFVAKQSHEMYWANLQPSLLECWEAKMEAILNSRTPTAPAREEHQTMQFPNTTGNSSANLIDLGGEMLNCQKEEQNAGCSVDGLYDGNKTEEKVVKDQIANLSKRIDSLNLKIDEIAMNLNKMNELLHYQLGPGPESEDQTLGNNGHEVSNEQERVNSTSALFEEWDTEQFLQYLAFNSFPSDVMGGSDSKSVWGPRESLENISSITNFHTFEDGFSDSFDPFQTSEDETFFSCLLDTPNTTQGDLLGGDAFSSFENFELQDPMGDVFSTSWCTYK